MVGWTAQSRINSRVKFKICDTMFLYSKKEQIFMIGTGLQEIESTHNKRQDATTLNWESNWQAQRGKVL